MQKVLRQKDHRASKVSWDFDVVFSEKIPSNGVIMNNQHNDYSWALWPCIAYFWRLTNIKILWDLAIWSLTNIQISQVLGVLYGAACGPWPTPNRTADLVCLGSPDLLWPPVTSSKSLVCKLHWTPAYVVLSTGLEYKIQGTVASAALHCHRSPQ